MKNNQSTVQKSDKCSNMERRSGIFSEKILQKTASTTRIYAVDFIFNFFSDLRFSVTFVTNCIFFKYKRVISSKLSHVTNNLLQANLLQFVTFLYNLLQSLLHFK